MTNRTLIVLTVGLLGVAVAAAMAFARRQTSDVQQVPLPPSGDEAMARLNASPRHGEWVKYDAGSGDSVMAWLVYPERSDPAPVVVVIHEIFGLTDWVRSVADQLAAEGFIAIAPDLLSGKGPDGGGTSSFDRDGAIRAIRSLDRSEIARRLDAASAYATALPAARQEFGVIGFCWGGSTSFFYATAQPKLKAAVVYYGTPPSKEDMAAIKAPVLALYGGDDARVTSTVEPTSEAMKALGKPYEPHVYEGAGHGFLRAQEGRDGANQKAADQAWPRTVDFLKSRLGS